MPDRFLESRKNSSGIRAALLAAGVFLTAGVCSAAAVPDSAKVTSVRFWSLGDVTRITIEVSSDFTFKYSHLTNPERMFFDIHGARPQIARDGIHTIAVGDVLVQQIRVAENQPDVTRVVIDLLQTASVTTSQLSNPNRLVLELRSKDAPLPPAQPSVTGGKDLTAPADRESTVSLVAAKPEPRTFEPPPVQPKAAAKEAPLPEVEAPTKIAALSKPARLPALPSTMPRELPPPPEAMLSSRPAAAASAVALKEPSSIKVPAPAKRGDRSLIRALGLKLDRVVIDAGHGGNDVGTHGPSGYYEKDLTLDVAQRLGALIEERMGSEVIFTRSDDTYVGLEERTRIANQHEADLFLSIHANSSPYRTAAGVETYVLNFTTSKSALELAARENATSDHSIHDLHELLEKIALKDKIDESREFASKLQNSLSVVSKNSTQGARNRGVKTAPFVVLIGAAMPSVLAEIGFLTNSSEEALLRKPEHRQKIAEALYKGIASYADTLSRVDLAKK
jgi:N-acetylmuramoyl-L-alanine amidase